MAKSKSNWVPWALGGGLAGAWLVMMSKSLGPQTIGYAHPLIAPGLAHPKTRAARRIQALLRQGYEAKAVETPSGVVIFTRQKHR